MTTAVAASASRKGCSESVASPQDLSAAQKRTRSSTESQVQAKFLGEALWRLSTRRDAFLMVWLDIAQTFFRAAPVPPSKEQLNIPHMAVTGPGQVMTATAEDDPDDDRQHPTREQKAAPLTDAAKRSIRRTGEHLRLLCAGGPSGTGCGRSAFMDAWWRISTKLSPSDLVSLYCKWRPSVQEGIRRPNVILQKILEFVCFYDYPIIEQVCRHWRAVSVQGGWSNCSGPLSEADRRVPGAVALAASRLARVRTLHVQTFPFFGATPLDWVWVKESSRSGQLKHLTFVAWPNVPLESLVEHAQNLQSLVLPDHNFIPNGRISELLAFTRLQTLSVGVVLSSETVKVLHALPDLRTLSFRDWQGQSTELDWRPWKLLHTITVSKINDESQNELDVSAWNGLPSLRTLRLGYGWVRDEQPLNVTLLGQLRTVKELHVDFHCEDEDEDDLCPRALRAALAAPQLQQAFVKTRMVGLREMCERRCIACRAAVAADAHTYPGQRLSLEIVNWRDEDEDEPDAVRRKTLQLSTVTTHFPHVWHLSVDYLCLNSELSILTQLTVLSIGDLDDGGNEHDSDMVQIDTAFWLNVSKCHSLQRLHLRGMRCAYPDDCVPSAMLAFISSFEYLELEECAGIDGDLLLAAWQCVRPARLRHSCTAEPVRCASRPRPRRGVRIVLTECFRNLADAAEQNGQREVCDFGFQV